MTCKCLEAMAETAPCQSSSRGRKWPNTFGITEGVIDSVTLHAGKSGMRLDVDVAASMKKEITSSLRRTSGQCNLSEIGPMPISLLISDRSWESGCVETEKC